MPITKQYEEEQINATYFNNEDFKFSWSTSEEYGYDDFWTEANENGEYKGKLDVSGLATTGMMINSVLVSEILNQAGKISLSGGSYELSGIEKSEGSDTKQWKLIVDNNEIKDKDIRWELISATTAELPDSISITNGLVSWTDQIAAGIYEFCILANYKETKIQSAPITLTISSKEVKSIENFGFATKNTLFDENTIDQKLLDFVNNINFSLEYTENDYDTEREDHKKGEIEINNFIIGYKNSKNTFKASNSINEVINAAINNDSTITSRYSKNLYSNLEHNYLVAFTIKVFTNTILFNEIESMSEHVNNMYTAGKIIFSTCTVLEAIFTICLISIIRKYKLYNNLVKKLVSVVACLLLVFIPLGYFISLVTEVHGYANDSLKWCKLSSQNDRGRTNFEDKLADDENYFLISNGKDEFDKLSNKQIRSLANFYTNFYIKPADYNKSDKKFADTPYRMYDEYLEFNDELEEATKHLFGVLISGLVLVSISFVVSLIIFCKSMISLDAEVRNNHLANVQTILALNPGLDIGIIEESDIIINNNNDINNSSRGSFIERTSQVIKNNVSKETAVDLKIPAEQFYSAGGENATLESFKNIIPNEFFDKQRYQFIRAHLSKNDPNIANIYFIKINFTYNKII